MDSIVMSHSQKLLKLIQLPTLCLCIVLTLIITMEFCWCVGPTIANPRMNENFLGMNNKSATLHQKFSHSSGVGASIPSTIEGFALNINDRQYNSVPAVNIQVVAGDAVYLPCDISTPDAIDQVLLVLWYREDFGTPIYSVDARDRDFSLAERWSDEHVFANRAYFMAEKQPAELGVDYIRESDQAIYRCRVDFKVSQTRNSKVNLTVIVPPQKIVILDESGSQLTSVIGPFEEQATFTLRCDVYGGKPIPVVQWFRNDNIVSNKSLVLNPTHVRSELRVTSLGRADVHSELTCQASNNKRTPPLAATLHLDMNFGPLNVKILGANQPLSASRRYDLLCQSSGSRPPATITWWRNGKRLDRTKETTSTDGNTTTSTLSFVATKDDDGKYLSCRAENKGLNIENLEDGWKLEIQFTPEARIILGTSLSPESIREGTDVYFDCIMNAHPYVYKVEWRHNGKVLSHNVAVGVIISNQSLVLQSVSRSTTGNYTCVGYNTEGDGESKPYYLNVMFSPTCRPNQIRIYGVAKQERAEIACQVDANPPDIQFRWTFNNSADSIDVAQGFIARTGTSSLVSYTPMTEMDYGTLLCYASNRIGKQRIPCVFHIIAAGRPDQVHNCSILNISMTSLSMRCTEGFNGGLLQSFLLEVRESATQEIRANVSSPVPRFSITGLEAGAQYQAAVFAYNAKGRSEPVIMQAATLRLPEKQLTAETDTQRNLLKFSPMMSVMIGIVSALLIVALVVIVVLRLQCRQQENQRRKRHKNGGIIVGAGSVGGVSERRGSFGGSTFSDKEGGSPISKNDSSGECDSDEKNPDIIPQPQELDECYNNYRLPSSENNGSRLTMPPSALIGVEALQQRIATIVTSSPNKEGGSVQGVSSNSGLLHHHQMSGQQQQNHRHQQYMAGYCTLRNGGHLSTGQPAKLNSQQMMPACGIAIDTLPHHLAMQHQSVSIPNTNVQSLVGQYRYGPVSHLPPTQGIYPTTTPMPALFRPMLNTNVMGGSLINRNARSIHSTTSQTHSVLLPMKPLGNSATTSDSVAPYVEECPSRNTLITEEVEVAHTVENKRESTV